MTITKLTPPSPEEMAEFQKSRYNDRPMDRLERVLEVDLTDEEFQNLKWEIIKTFK